MSQCVVGPGASRECSPVTCGFLLFCCVSWTQLLRGLGLGVSSLVRSEKRDPSPADRWGCHCSFCFCDTVRYVSALADSLTLSITILTKQNVKQIERGTNERTNKGHATTRADINYQHREHITPITQKRDLATSSSKKKGRCGVARRSLGTWRSTSNSTCCSLHTTDAPTCALRTSTSAATAQHQPLRARQLMLS